MCLNLVLAAPRFWEQDNMSHGPQGYVCVESRSISNKYSSSSSQFLFSACAESYPIISISFSLHKKFSIIFISHTSVSHKQSVAQGLDR